MNITIWVQEDGKKRWIEDNDVKYFPNEEKYKRLLDKINKEKEVIDESSDSKVSIYVVTGYFLEKDELNSHIPFMALVGPEIKSMAIKQLEQKVIDLGFHIKEKKIWTRESFLRKHWKKIVGLSAIIAAIVFFYLYNNN